VICRKRDARISRGEVSEVRETPGWEGIRVQIGSGAMDAVGPKENAKAFWMKETAIGHVAANGSGSEYYGEKKIAGYTEGGKGGSLRIQCPSARVG
jgi:hypothetical protein